MSVAQGASSKFYFIVSPSTSKQHKLIFTINGISRSVTQTLTFEVGKVTKFTVPINDLTRPHISDALNVKSTGLKTGGNKVLDLGNAVKSTDNQPTVTINGQIGVPIYSVGGENQRTMLLRGSAKDIINALDAGFYATTWPGQPSAMTITNIQLYIDGYQLSEYQPFLEGLKTALLPSIKKLTLGSATLAEKAWEEGYDGRIIDIPPLKEWVINMMKDGIPRDGTLLYLGRFIDYQTITFNGVVEAGASNDNQHLVVLTEEHIYKGIDVNLINRFLNDRTHPMGGKFIYQIGEVTYKPTYQGLYDLINYDSTKLSINSDDDVKKISSERDDINGNNETYAYNTAYAIYNKLLSTIGNQTFSLAGVFDVEFKTVFDALFSSLGDMVKKLPNIEFEITISTCDHKPNKADYSGVQLKDMQKTNNPIIFWGLDAYGPNKSSLSN